MYSFFDLLKVACRVKTNITWKQKTQLPFIILAKNIETNTLHGHKRYIKIIELEINDLRVQILTAKMTQFHLISLSRAPSPDRINFSVEFSVQYIHITRIFKKLSYFFLLLCGFSEMRKSVGQRVIVQSHLKRMLDS